MKVLAAGIDGATDSPWLVMELLEGEDLASHVARVGLLSVSDVRGVLEQLCHALEAAHAQGIVHRDLKPENVFLGRARQVRVSSVVKVLDFGIAKLIAETRAATTQAIGTPLWMAPEQAQPGNKISAATDVWSLGLLAYWLLSGRYYWRAANEEGLTPMALMKEVLLDELGPASQRSTRALPAGFDAWFSRAVCREPEKRFADAGEAWRALEPLLGQSSTMPMLPAMAMAKTEPAPTAPVHAAPEATVPMSSSTQAALARTQAGAPAAGGRVSVPRWAYAAAAAVVVILLAIIFRPAGEPSSVASASVAVPSMPSVAPTPALPEPSTEPAPERDDSTVRMCFKVKPEDAQIVIDGMTLGQKCRDFVRGQKKKATITKDGYLPVEWPFTPPAAGDGDDVVVELKKATRGCPKGQRWENGRCRPSIQTF